LVSLSRQEKRVLLSVAGILLLGCGVLAWKHLDPGAARDLVCGGFAEGRPTVAPPDSGVVAERVRERADDRTLAGHIARVQRASSGPRAGAPPGVRRIDLNAASEAELVLLDGIGPARAREIVRYRASIGPFRRVEDIEKVRGIGPGTVARIAPWVCVAESLAADRAK
jgi:competence ComEA-like helix-hairpin-helix protein